jgi:hypothetical protein
MPKKLAATEASNADLPTFDVGGVSHADCASVNGRICARECHDQVQPVIGPERGLLQVRDAKPSPGQI